MSPLVVRQRLAEWDLWRIAVPLLREENQGVVRENRALKKQLRIMKHDYEAKIEALELRIEQLSTMVFGPPRSERADEKHKQTPPLQNGQRERRPASSYRRRVPGDEEVTSRRAFPLSACPNCGGQLTDTVTVTRYVEDIPLPLEGKSLKTVEKRTIACGYCRCCGRKVSALPLGPQVCELGPNVQMYIAYAVTVLGQTWGKVQVFLRDVCGIAVSDGEIAAVLQRQHRALLPALARIEERIRDGPAAHYDETTWPVAEEHAGRFGWVKTSSSTPHALFRLGRSRGKGNAEELRGEDRGQPAVTDDFGAYDTLFDRHGLCWAHAQRKFRELAETTVLRKKKLQRCQTFFRDFQALYAAVNASTARPMDARARAEQAAAFSARIDVLCTPQEGDPPLLAQRKATFLQHREQYLLCVREQGVPMTNNKAERALRPLVIKRKLSFGSKTHKGAQAMETLLSVLFTLWWSRPANFFAAYQNLLQSS